ncbi:MAG: NlpC/P60 family protein, partial [Actinomycetes bacterium]
LDQVRAQLAALDAQGEVAQEQLNQTQVQMAAAQRSLAQVRARVVRSQAQVDAAQARVGVLASAAYRSGGVDQTLELLLADNPSQFLEQMTVLDQVSSQQSQVLRAAAVAEQRLAQDKLAAAQQVKVWQGLNAQAVAHRAAVQAAQDKASALVASLTAAQAAALQAQADAARAAAKAAAAAALARAQAEAAAAAAVDAAASKARAKTKSPKQKSSKPARSTRRTKPPASSGGSHSSTGSSIGQRVVAYALAQVGDAYKWGATGPNAFDCSGLTMRAYARVGISLPHSSSAQFGSGRHISLGNLQPGDLVFFYSPIHHVGIYIGGGMIVHAANPSEGVTTAPLDSMPYDGAVRPY